MHCNTLAVSGGGGATLVFDHSVGTNFTLGGLSSNGALSLQTNAPSPAAITLTVGGNHASSIHTGGISGSGGLTKIGDGTLTLAGHNTFTGATEINAGTLKLGRTTLPSGLDIMPKGDSITYGDQGSDAGYRGPLYQRLQAVAPGFDFVGNLTSYQANVSLPAGYLDHEGHSGWKAVDLTALNPLAPGNGIQPDVVLLQIGTNDLLTYNGYNTQLKSDLEALVTQLTNNRPDASILLASITPTSNRNGVAAYNAMVATVVTDFQTAGKRVRLVDNTTNFPGTGLADGTHPNDVGYS